MPLDDLSPQESHVWIGEAFAEALTSHLQSSGEEVVGLSELHRQLREKGLSPGVALTRASVIVIGRELGASRAIVGSYRVEESQVEANLKVLDLDRGAILGVIEDHGHVKDLIDLENQFAKNLFHLNEDPVPASFRDHAARRRTLSLEAHEKLARARFEYDPPERRKLLEEALAINPDYLEAKLMLGRTLLEMNRPVESIRMLSSIRHGEYVYREAYFILGLAYLDANRTAAAKEIFTHLSDQEQKAPFLNNLGIALLRTGATEEAIERFYQAAEQERESALYLFNLGWSNWRAGKGSEALRWFREAVRYSPEDAEAHLLLSAAARAQALPQEAGEERERAMALSPGLADIDPSTVEGLERIADRLPARSADAAEGMEGGSTESEQDALERASAQRASGRIEEAAEELQRAVYLHPHWVQARLELAEIYRESGDLGKAVGEYRVVLWDKENAATHLRVAEVYLEMGNQERARVHAQRALELDPASSEAHRLVDKLKER